MSTWPEPHRRLSEPRRAGCLIWALTGFVLGALAIIIALMALPPRQTTATVPTATEPGPGHITVTLDDATLSQLAAAGVQNANLPVPVNNVHAHIQAGDALAIAGDAALPLVGTRPFAAAAQLSVADGRLALRLTRGLIGDLSLPAPALAALESALNDRLAAHDLAIFPGGPRYVLTGLTTSDGRLTLILAPA